MALGKVETLGAGGISSAALAFIAYFKIGGDLKELLMTIIPITLSCVIFIYEYLRVVVGWSSFQEAAASRNYKLHQDKIDDQIKRCETDLQNPLLLPEHRKELQTNLYKLMQSRQRIPKVAGTASPPRARTP